MLGGQRFRASPGRDAAHRNALAPDPHGIHPPSGQSGIQPGKVLRQVDIDLIIPGLLDRSILGQAFPSRETAERSPDSLPIAVASERTVETPQQTVDAVFGQRRNQTTQYR